MTGEPAATVIAPVKPRRRRRLLRFSLWVSGALVLLWSVAFLHATWSLNQAIAELKRRGEPTTFAEAVAANERNAATENGADLIRQAFAENERIGKPGETAYNFPGIASAAFSTNDLAVLSPLIAKSESVAALLERAFTLPAGPLTVDADLSRVKHPFWFDSVQDLRSLGKLLYADIRFSIGTGDSRRGFRRLKALYLFSEQFSAEAFVIPQLIRIAVIGLGVGSTRHILSRADFTADELAELAHLVARIDRNLNVTPALVNQRALEASIFQDRAAFVAELQSNARARFRTGAAATPAFIFFEYRWIDLITSPLGLPARRRAAAQTLSIPQEVLELADVPPPWTQEHSQSFDRWNDSLNIDRLSINGSPGGGASVLMNAARRMHRQLAMMQLAFRLRRFDLIHRKLPDRLEDLCDESMPEVPTKWFEGKPFVFSKKGRSFTLTADPSITPEIALTNNQQREAWGLLFGFDADAAKSQPSPSK